MTLDIIDTHAHYWQQPAPAATLGDADRPVTYEEMVGLMRDAGVNRMLQVTRYFDLSDDYSLAGVQAHPQHFHVIGRYDSSMLRHPESLNEWYSRPGIVGLRLFAHPTDVRVFGDDADAFWSQIARLGIPVSAYAPGHLWAIGVIAQTLPDVRIVVDHAGADVFAATPAAERFLEHDTLLSLARHPNVFVKASGLPEATDEVFPYPGAQLRMRELCGIFGADRVMWGSNFTPAARVGRYSDHVEFARRATAELLPDEAAAVLHGTAERVFGLVG